MKYKAAIFDMDGTILNTIEDLADTMNYCLLTHGLPERSLDEIRSFVGNGIYRLIECAVPEGTGAEKIDEIFTQFRPYYREHSTIKTRPYDGVADAIRTLREAGVLTAVVSNKLDMAVRDLCELYFPGLFDYSVGEREGQKRKPAPDGVYAALEHFGITKEEAVYIGDSDVDYATAQNAGMDRIMVGWGFRDEAFLLSLGADHVIHDPCEIVTEILG